jgi:hypothetical protein
MAPLDGLIRNGWKCCVRQVLKYCRGRTLNLYPHIPCIVAFKFHLQFMLKIGTLTLVTVPQEILWLM